MSKLAAIIVGSRRRRCGGARLALATLALLPALATAASIPEPVLRPSRELDIRRLGKVSEDERALLRVAWRAAQTGADETRGVQDMLDRLRRMEVTVAEIGRMVRAMGAPAPHAAAVAPVAAAPGESADDRLRWALAGGGTLALLALWLFRRRTRSAPAPAASEPPGADPVVTTSGDIARPEAKPAGKRPPTVEPPAAASDPEAAAMPVEAHVSTVLIPPAPAAAQPPDLERTVSFAAVRNMPAPAAPASIGSVDFSLDDADPQLAARQQARIPVLRTKAAARVPERRQELTIEPTLQLAEIMLSMGLQQGAAQALIEYAEAHPRQAVYHWLKLLAIYRDAGLRKDFEETAAKLRKHFNIKAADPAAPGGDEAVTLESFPRVAQQIERIWVQPDQCMAYLRHLLQDNRDGERTGFPQAVAEELLLLIEVLKGSTGGDQARVGL